MFILMPVIFVLGILAIALEDKIKINKNKHTFKKKNTFRKLKKKKKSRCYECCWR